MVVRGVIGVRGMVVVLVGRGVRGVGAVLGGGPEAPCGRRAWSRIDTASAAEIDQVMVAVTVALPPAPMSSLRKSTRTSETDWSRAGTPSTARTMTPSS